MRFQLIDKRFKSVEKRIESVNESINKAIKTLSLASTESHKVVIDFMALKGVVEKEEAEYLSRRVEGVFRLYTYTNPLSREEIEFLKNFFSRAARNADDVTIEEAEKAYELGVKMYVEDLDPRGYMAAIAAAFVRGYLVSKEVKRKTSISSK